MLEIKNHKFETGSSAIRFNEKENQEIENKELLIVEEIKGELKPEDQVEYMIINEGQKVIRRKI